MKVFQSRSFEQKVKKFSTAQKLALDEQIKQIMEDPSIGTEKKGDLRGIYIHKFKIKTTQYLLAYRTIEENLELIMVGPHQNYYRDLKKYIKST